MLDLLEDARLLGQFRIVNAHDPANIQAALAGENVGTTIDA